MRALALLLLAGCTLIIDTRGLADGSRIAPVTCGDAGTCDGADVCCADFGADTFRCGAAGSCTTARLDCTTTAQCSHDGSRICCCVGDLDNATSECLTPDECRAKRTAERWLCAPGDGPCPEDAGACIVTKDVPGHYKCEAARVR